jgi:ABC-2 type transport system ATP-binding protein
MRIEARGLTRRFGSLVALDGLDLDLPSGRRVALVGPNGSGKSTLGRVLLGLLDYEGEVRVGGSEPARRSLEEARRISYVPQVTPSLAAPSGELVATLAALRDIDVHRIEKLACELDLDIAAISRRPFRALSGGMRQKLLLAAALAPDPSLIVLDEPTASLDPASRERLFTLFEQHCGAATVLLCSHRLEEIRQLVDHVLLLEDGRLRYAGPAEAFLAASTSSIVEALPRSRRGEERLQDLEFRRGASGWWSRLVAREGKQALIAELALELEDDLADLNVRDLESLELAEDTRPESAS